MAIFALDDILSTFKDGISRALRVKSETSITGGYSPANLTMQNAVTTNGNGTLLNVNEYATAVLEVRGTFSATINFESSIDDTNWYPVLATKNDGTISSSCTTVGLYEIKVAGEKSVRARISGYVSGNVTVVGKVSPLVNTEKSMQLTDSLPAGTNNIGDVDVLTLPSLTAGSAIIGKVGIDQSTPGVTNGVQITNKNTVLLQTSFNALAITDTTQRFAAALPFTSVAPYREIFLYVATTLDNASHNANPNIYVYDNGAGLLPTAIKVLTGGYGGETQIISKSDIAALATLGFGVQISVKCANAPTGGSITIKAYGIPN